MFFSSHVHPFWEMRGNQAPLQLWSLTLPNSQYHSGHNATWIQSTGDPVGSLSSQSHINGFRSSLPQSSSLFSLYCSKFGIFHPPFFPSRTLYSELHPSLCLSTISRPLVGMRQSWHAVREHSLNYLALAFWSSASFPWPACFVCLLLFDGAWRIYSLFIPLEGHDGPLTTTHRLKDLTLRLIAPNVQLPAIRISTKSSTQIYGGLAGVEATFDRFWEE